MARKTKKNGAGQHVGLTAAKVKKAYKQNKQNASATARDLGVSAATIQYWLRQ